jgi:hypothetical protein
MRGPEPKYLRPVIGYLMYQLRHGLSPDEAVIKALEYRAFRGISTAQVQRALRWAWANHNATQRCIACAAAHWRRPPA